MCQLHCNVASMNQPRTLGAEHMLDYVTIQFVCIKSIQIISSKELECFGSLAHNWCSMLIFVPDSGASMVQQRHCAFFCPKVQHTTAIQWECGLRLGTWDFGRDWRSRVRDKCLRRKIWDLKDLEGPFRRNYTRLMSPRWSNSGSGFIPRLLWNLQPLRCSFRRLAEAPMRCTASWPHHPLPLETSSKYVSRHSPAHTSPHVSCKCSWPVAETSGIAKESCPDTCGAQSGSWAIHRWCQWDHSHIQSWRRNRRNEGEILRSKPCKMWNTCRGRLLNGCRQWWRKHGHSTTCQPPQMSPGPA